MTNWEWIDYVNLYGEHARPVHMRDYDPQFNEEIKYLSKKMPNILPPRNIILYSKFLKDKRRIYQS